MLHLLFVLAVIVIGIALLPMALAVLPWLVVGALSVAVFAGLLLFVVMAPQAAATVAVLTAIVALLLRTGQAAHGWSRRADRAWGRRLGKEPPLLPTPDHEPRSEARLAKAAEELHAAAVEHLGLLEREVKQAQESIAPAIERRKTLAESLQLANRVHTVAADVRYYPSWSKNAPALVCDLVSTVSVQEQSVNEWLVIFDLQGRRYSIARLSMRGIGSSLRSEKIPGPTTVISSSATSTERSYSRPVSARGSTVAGSFLRFLRSGLGSGWRGLSHSPNAWTSSNESKAFDVSWTTLGESANASGSTPRNRSQCGQGAGTSSERRQHERPPAAVAPSMGPIPVT